MASLRNKPKIPKIRLNKEIHNLSELAILTQTLNEEFSKHMANMAKTFMYEYIEESIYRDNDLKGNGDENFYDRTNQFLNSVTIRRYANGQWGVLIDGRKMLGGIEPSDTSKWGQHTGFDGQSSSKDLATWIDEGTTSKAYPLPGIHFVRKTEEYINKVQSDEFSLFCALNGIKIS